MEDTSGSSGQSREDLTNWLVFGLYHSSRRHQHHIPILGRATAPMGWALVVCTQWLSANIPPQLLLLVLLTGSTSWIDKCRLSRSPILFPRLLGCRLFYVSTQPVQDSVCSPQDGSCMVALTLFSVCVTVRGLSKPVGGCNATFRGWSDQSISRFCCKQR